MDGGRRRPLHTDQQQTRRHLQLAAAILTLTTVYAFAAASHLRHCYLAICATLLASLASSRALPYLISSLAVGAGVVLEVSQVLVSSFAYHPHMVIECIVRFMHMALLYLTLRVCLEEYHSKRSAEEERLRLLET